MKEINGIYASAKIFTTSNTDTAIDNYAIAQLQMLCDNESLSGSRIRVMPDVHPGKVGTIGLTMTIGDKIMPNLTGIDIGCGISLAGIRGKVKEFQKLDSVIRERIPSGFQARKEVHPRAEDFDYGRLICCNHIQRERCSKNLGTLGSGNHFIELDQDNEKNTYLVVHSGSRHLGKEVTEYYLAQGQKELQEKGISLPYELTYLEGELKEQYLHDAAVVTEYAARNREIIIAEICKGMKFKIEESYSCIHNYIDQSDETRKQFGAPLLRKGAISAKTDERVIIPINMRDGIILGTGLGNPEWNCSAPHGSGRLWKREDVKNHYTVSHFKSAMKGIYSTSIGKETLDEAPFAYRGMDEIQEAIQNTVKIEKVLKPIYNFKAGNM
ncbi:MAG: RtcB family protein [Clostridium sp.]|nr:RtcB family protein [Clostridium sp.]